METLENILFDVEKVDMQEITGFPANKDYQYGIVGHIDGKKKLLNVCSDRYELVPNSEIFPKIRNILNEGGLEFSEKYESFNDARFYADYIIESDHVKIGQSENDIIKPKISIRHSYNGMTQYAIIFGYYRMVCSNGLVVPVKGKEAQNLHIMGKHTISIRTSLDMLMNRLNTFISNMNLYKQTFDQLGGQWIENPQKRIEEALEASKIPTKYSSNIMETVQKEAQTIYDGSINDWLIYNGINQFIHKGDNKKVPEQREKYDYAAIDFLTK
ncbi:MAG: DUF932 domain-containing protein [archaeon]